MWQEGTINKGKEQFHYWLKSFEENSMYGIEDGKISKLTIKRNGTIVCNYDRGWDIEPSSENAKKVLKQLLNEYN